MSAWERNKKYNMNPSFQITCFSLCRTLQIHLSSPKLRVLFSLLMQIGERVGEDLIDGGFASARGSDQHDAVTHDHGFVELNDLLDDDLLGLQLPVDLGLVDGRLHDAVVMLRQNHAREQILQDGLEHGKSSRLICNIS